MHFPVGGDGHVGTMTATPLSLTASPVRTIISQPRNDREIGCHYVPKPVTRRP
jgi:hypothetical protein